MTSVRLVALAVTAVLVVTSTGGYGSVTANREVSVGIAPDDEALLGIETASPTLTPGRNRDVTLLKVQNHFQSPVETLQVTVTDETTGPPKISPDGDVSAATSLGPGASTAVEADVVCRPGSSGRVVVSLDATGTDFEVSLRRTVQISCSEPSTEGAASSPTTPETPQPSGRKPTATTRTARNR
ncbi:hypothetical protein QA599_10875 [Haloarculaceae archaeon H-GB1-1]|nr:hypothetical protein [Haloarculaceae archaeon H-GB1-1]